MNPGQRSEINQRRAVVVAGMHRSGTSAVARLLAQHGLSLPRTPMGPTEANITGHWGESEQIWSLHEKLLASAGSAWDDVSPFPSSWMSSADAQEYRARFVAVLREEYPDSKAFVLKDPRICRLLPFWLSVLEDLEARPSFVLPFRNPLEVAASLKRRDGFTASKGLLLWLRHVLDAERGTRELPRAFVSYSDLLRDWRSSARAISASIDLAWPLATHRVDVELDRFLSHDQRHHEFSADELGAREDVVAWVKEAYALLLDSRKPDAVPNFARLDELHDALAEADLAYGPLLAESQLHGEELRRHGEELRRRLESERAESKTQRADLEAVLVSQKAASNREAEARAELADREAELRAELAAREAERSQLTALVKAEKSASDRRGMQLRAELTALEAERARLEAERGRLDAQLESQSSDSNRRELQLRAELTALEARRGRLEAQLESQRAGSDRRETELRAALTDSERELHSAETALIELRESRLSHRLRTAWRRGRARTAQRYRSLKQLGSWLLNPFSRGRNVWEYFVLRRSGRFDPMYYLEQNDDFARAGMSPLMHYLEHGVHEGRDPNPWFKTAAYLERHPGLLDERINPLYHFHRSRGEPPRPDGAPGPAPKGESAVVPVSADESLNTPQELRRAPDDPAAAIPADVLEAARRSLVRNPISVSVVVPTHNRAQQLVRALRSAFDQAYAPLEVIVCDDGSSDETRERLREEFGAEFDAGRLQYIRHEQRRGPSAARNTALEAAAGDLVAYLDSDNTWHRHFLQLMAATLAERDDAATVYCGFNVRVEGDELKRQRFEPYARSQLLIQNYIDLNAFVHRRRVFDQLGGFDEDMTRLVDWDLIIRYTGPYPPVTVPYYLVEYYAAEDGSRVTYTEDFASNASIVKRRVAHELAYSGVSPPRIGYVLWDFPALSQTFVLNELRHLREAGYDVCVYYHTDPDRSAQLDFDVPAFQVDHAEALAALLAEHDRTILHSHFAYPAVTRLTYPAAQATGLPFTFSVHGVDIFHRANIERNRIAEITRNELCVRVFGVGRYHRQFLIERGVPPDKISIARPAMALGPSSDEAIARRMQRPARVVACIARFVEKKGIDDLIKAGALLGAGVEIRLYGYGPLEEDYRRLADELGADCVRFEGALEDSDAVRAALDSADIFVLPCVVDSNSDMDGLPTVLGEAMAAGVPVITTDVSSIPDAVKDGISGFVVPPREPERIARKVTELVKMDRRDLLRRITTAQRVVADAWNVDKTVQALLDAWERPPVEVALVTYSRGQDQEAKTTAEIIRRIYELTTTHFNLTVVDNGSADAFRESLQTAMMGRRNASLVLLDRNVHWGPAVNLAFRSGRSEVLVYICSKEGFVLRSGWEREFIDHLRAHREVALAGHLVSSPAFPNGRAYTRQSWFEGFRNKHFAEDNPNREFFHVQGGLFALRRSAFEGSGGFSERVAQDAVDIEYSHLLESLGWRLGKVERIPSVTKKTRPGVQAHMDENTLAAHPLSLDSVDWATAVVGGRAMVCNVCTWTGDRFQPDGEVPDTCPQCGSTPFGRLLYRYLASSELPFRQLKCLALMRDKSMDEHLERMFTLTRVSADGLNAELGTAEVVIADTGELPEASAPGAIGALAGALRNGGVAVAGGPLVAAGRERGNALSDAFFKAGLRPDPVLIQSRALRFPPDGLLVGRRSGPERVPGAPPGG